jgi:hypothetical protein
VRREDSIGLQQQGASYREDRYASTLFRLVYDNGAAIVDGYYSPVTSKHQLEIAGFYDIHQAIIRIPKTEPIKPQLEKMIRVLQLDGSSILLRINAFPVHEQGEEWVLGCGQVI